MRMSEVTEGRAWANFGALCATHPPDEGSLAHTRPVASRPRKLARNDSVSAPIHDVRYDVTFTRANAPYRVVDVAMTFATAGRRPSCCRCPRGRPARTRSATSRAGSTAFEVTRRRQAALVGQARLRHVAHSPGRREVGARDVSLRADTLDNAMAWARPDFLLFNGTNLFLYPEGQPLDFPATVTVHTETDWRVATRDERAGRRRGTYTASNYHDLVDMPFFVGRFDLDSARIVEPVGAIWRRIPPERSSAAQRDDRVGPAQAGDSAGDRGVRRDAVGELHGHADRRLDVRRRERARASELARRRPRAVLRRQRVPAVALRARDLSLVEREAAASGGDVAVRLFASAADAVALGVRGNHRLLRRSRRGARRRRRRERLLRADGRRR